MDQELHGLHTFTGEWVLLASWQADGAEFDSTGWLEKYGCYVGLNKDVNLPDGSVVQLQHFSSLRPISK